MPIEYRIDDERRLGMDPPNQPSKFAIVAPDPLVDDLARFFRIYRELDARSTKRVEVFRARDKAPEWLGVERVPD